MLTEIQWDANTMGVVAPCLVVVVVIVSFFFFMWNKVRSDNELKQSMVDRGMSAEEIERVMASGSVRRARSQGCGRT